MKKSFILFCFLISVVGISRAQDSLKSDRFNPDGYLLVWQEEFNDFSSDNGKPAMPNTTRWSYETGDHGWGNNEIQNYVAGVSGIDTCTIVSDGTLKIIAKKKGREVISARLNTLQSWTYGYFEARLKLPVGKGTWPAFWMLPRDFKTWPEDGEIDIMEEVGVRPNWTSSAIHTAAYNHKKGTHKTGEQYIPTAESEFHVYGLEWTPDYIKGYVDGKAHFIYHNDKAGDKTTWPFDKPFYLKLNLAWGGDWGGMKGVDETALPATYEVDYVRVYQKRSVPMITLNNGVQMPVLGFGTHALNGSEARNSVGNAISLGYRMIDTANIYANEEEVGEGIKKSGIERKDLFITTKLWVDDMGYEAAKKGFEASLRKLGTDYIDLYLIHRPRPHKDIKGSWKAMEELYNEGKIRAIGVSNFDTDQLKELLSYAKVKPAVNQIETHVLFQQFAAQRDLNNMGIQMEAWSPLVGGRGDIFNNPILTAIGKKYNKSNAQIAIRWIIQRGIITVPRTSNLAYMSENLDVFDFELDAADMKQISDLDLNKTQFPEWE